jgi:hypothetical protein
MSVGPNRNPESAGVVRSIRTQHVLGLRPHSVGGVTSTPAFSTTDNEELPQSVGL